MDNRERELARDILQEKSIFIIYVYILDKDDNLKFSLNFKILHMCFYNGWGYNEPGDNWTGIT